MLTATLGYASMIHEDAPPKSSIQEQAGQIRRSASVRTRFAGIIGPTFALRASAGKPARPWAWQ
jgi:hypothetical protein